MKTTPSAPASPSAQPAPAQTVPNPPAGPRPLPAHTAFAVIEAMVESCLILNGDLRIVHANPPAQRLLHRSPRELTGESLHAIFSDELAAEVAETLEAAQRDGRSVEILGRIERHETAPEHIICLVPSDDLCFLLIRALPEDQRSELEQRALALSQELLRNNNLELNRMLKRLETVNAELAESARLKSEFLANTSHELRTPLNAIMGFLQMITDDLCESEEERERYVQSALKSAQHLLSLINDILDIAKIEAGEVQLKLSEVDISALFDDVEEMLCGQAGSAGLELSLRIADNARRPVYADGGKLKQVLINLVGNAIKFTPSGYVRVTAAGYPGEPETLLFSIEDSGIGIPEEYHEKVFEKFTQVDGSSTRQYEGTGLGLAICKHYINLMGGSIWIVKSGKDTGTTISFTLPSAVAMTGDGDILSDDPESLKGLLPDTF